MELAGNIIRLSSCSGLTFLLVSEVYSYLPDPAAAKRLLEVLSKALKFKIDMEKLDIEIQKQKKL